VKNSRLFISLFVVWLNLQSKNDGAGFLLHWCQKKRFRRKFCNPKKALSQPWLLKWQMDRYFAL
ncbi:MAG: hypothetical protein EAZ26_13825, partial [Runella slithyformis]